MSNKKIYRVTMPISQSRVRTQDKKFWDNYDYPEVIRNQFFADLLSEEEVLAYSGQWDNRYYLNKGKSVVYNTVQFFQVRLNIDQFRGSQIVVKFHGDYLIIHAKHEEKEDFHVNHSVSREVTRRYVLPSNCDVNAASAKIIDHNLLIVKVPKIGEKKVFNLLVDDEVPKLPVKVVELATPMDPYSDMSPRKEEAIEEYQRIVASDTVSVDITSSSVPAIAMLPLKKSATIAECMQHHGEVTVSEQASPSSAIVASIERPKSTKLDSPVIKSPTSMILQSPVLRSPTSLKLDAPVPESPVSPGQLKETKLPVQYKTSSSPKVLSPESYKTFLGEEQASGYKSEIERKLSPDKSQTTKQQSP